MNRIRLFALLLALTLLAGCAAGTQPVQQTGNLDSQSVPDNAAAPDQSAAAEEDGTQEEKPVRLSLTLAWSAEDALNPYRAETSVNRQLGGLMYEGLFTITPDGAAEGVLCDRYEASADGKTYTFHLKSGVKMHDEALLTEDDVIASLQAARNSERYGYRLRHISSVLSIQPGTVTVQLDTAYENLPLLLDVPVLRAAEVDEAVPAGTGAYCLSGQRLIAFSDYWGGAASFGTSIGLLQAVTADELCDAFTGGELSLVCVDPNGASGPVYHSACSLFTRETNAMQYLGFNCADGVFQSAGLRSAITYLVDRERLVSEYCAAFAQGTVLPTHPYGERYDRGLAIRYDYDPDAFTAALEEAGIRDLDGDGVLDVPVGDATVRADCTLLVCSGYPQRARIANELAAVLTQHGIQVTVRSLPAEEYRAALRAGSYDLYYGETVLPPDGDLSAFFDPQGELCLPGMSNTTALLQCEAALENAGNFYTLYETVMEEGLLCPVLFKQNAVYVQQSLTLTMTPSSGNLYYRAPETEKEAAP